ncbi:MAG: hypothetical protein U7127_09235 [Phormidium sp.]
MRTVIAREIDNNRDVNAACNIRDEGLRMLEVGHTLVASGERVRPSKGTDESEASLCEGRISPGERQLKGRVSN